MDFGFGVAPPVLEVPTLGDTQRLVSLPPLFLVDARTGAPPRLSTAVRVGLRVGPGGRALCVRFDGRDAGVVATYTGRDDPLWKEDVFEVFLAPGADAPAAYYEFEVNPLGALFDALVESPNGSREGMRVRTEWDCPGLGAKVTRRAGEARNNHRRDGTRWSASLRIPLDPLLDDRETEVWRANFYRVDRVKGAADEFSAWSPTLRDPADFHVPESFGVLRFPR